MRVTKKWLEETYKNNLSKDVCKKLGITNPTLRTMLKLHGIQTKGKGNRVSKKKIEVY